MRLYPKDRRTTWPVQCDGCRKLHEPNLIVGVDIGVDMHYCADCLDELAAIAIKGRARITHGR